MRVNASFRASEPRGTGLRPSPRWQRRIATGCAFIIASIRCVASRV